eukprot:m.16822 g.16822  ORF g.16822 m.16822 type:complete len:91 (+) comp3427_c0_seq1:108-380(+)
MFEYGWMGVGVWMSCATPCMAQLDAASMSPHSEGDEDDLLAGIEEDIFGQDDVLGEDDERGMSNMDDLNLDLEHFGFGGDVTEDDEDDGC